MIHLGNMIPCTCRQRSIDIPLVVAQLFSPVSVYIKAHFQESAELQALNALYAFVAKEFQKLHEKIDNLEKAMKEFEVVVEWNQVQRTSIVVCAEHGFRISMTH